MSRSEASPAAPAAAGTSTPQGERIPWSIVVSWGAPVIGLSGLLHVASEFECREKTECAVLVKTESSGEIAHTHLCFRVEDFQHTKCVHDGLDRVLALRLAGILRHRISPLTLHTTTLVHPLLTRNDRGTRPHQSNSGSRISDQ